MAILKKQPDSAIDVHLYHFGRLLDEVLDASYLCEITEGVHDRKNVTLAYKQARERFLNEIRELVAKAMSAERGPVTPAERTNKTPT